MNDCSFERLLRLVEKRLGTEAQLKLFDHLDRCEICRESVYHIVRDRDEALQVLLPLDPARGILIPTSEMRGSAAAKFARARRSLARPTATGTNG